MRSSRQYAVGCRQNAEGSVVTHIAYRLPPTVERRVRPHTAYRQPPTAARSGISLMEVLISIAIMAIGLLSVAALIPVGGIQAQRAEIEQRKADLGLNAFRDFKTRAMGRMPSASELLSSSNPSNNASYQWYKADHSPYFASGGPPWTATWPVAIDPLMAAASQGSSTVQNFPAYPTAASGTAPTMQRLTLSSVYNGTAATYFALADAVFCAMTTLPFISRPTIACRRNSTTPTRKSPPPPPRSTIRPASTRGWPPSRPITPIRPRELRPPACSPICRSPSSTAARSPT